MKKESLALNVTLRKQGLSPQEAATILTQSRLRAKAQTKFGAAANHMLFTANGLEQATRPVVTKQHAERYRKAGCRVVLDLTCGIGADSIGFAQAGLRVVSVDIDPETAVIARWNLRSIGLDAATSSPRRFANESARTPSSHSMTVGESPSPVEVICGDGLAVAKAKADTIDGIFADPARRDRADRGKRQQIFDLDQYLPPLSEILALRSRIPAIGIKVAPIIPHDAISTAAEAQWVSVDGEVVECGLWFGPLAENGPGRTALLVKTRGPGTETEPLVRLVTASGNRSASGIERNEVGRLGQYIFEPDGAIIRAGLIGIAAEELNAHLLEPNIAYLTGDKASEKHSNISLGGAYRVNDVMPFNLKKLKAYLRERNIGRLTIKKRGVPITPEQLRPQLALKGDNEATIIVTRIKGKQTVIVVEPL